MKGAKRYLILIVILPMLISCGKKDKAGALLADKKVLFLGNSITRNGAYVSYIEYYLRKKYPKNNIDIISIGLSSETVSCLTEKDHPFPRPCLKERLTRALEKVRPEVVVACYGMNDGIYHPQSPARMQKFQEGIQNLLQQVDQINAAAVLVTPPVFDALPIADKVVDATAEEFGYAHPYKGYDTVLEDYSHWLSALKMPDVQIIDIHGPMRDWIGAMRVQNPSFTFAEDGIHPSPSGHLFMARTFLKHFDFSFTGDLRSESNKMQSDSLFQLVNKRRKLRSDGWLKYVGYIRGDTVSHTSIEATELQATQLNQQIMAFND